MRAADGGRSEGFGADGPYGSDPRQIGAGAPLVGHVDPEARAGCTLDVVAGFESEQRGVADQQRSVRAGEHGYGIGGRGEEFRVGVEEPAEEDLRVGEGTAGGGVCRDGADGGEHVVGGFAAAALSLDDELNGADMIE